MGLGRVAGHSAVSLIQFLNRPPKLTQIWPSNGQGQVDEYTGYDVRISLTKHRISTNGQIEMRAIANVLQKTVLSKMQLSTKDAQFSMLGLF